MKCHFLNGISVINSSESKVKIIIRAIDGISETVGNAVSWLTALMVVVVCYDVFTRYFLKNSLVAIQELQWHLFAIIFLLAAPYTLKHDRHVRVDVWYAKRSPRTKAWVNFIGSLLLLIPFCFVVAYASWDFVANSFAVRETSPDPGGLPARYILKALIPISMILLLFQGVAELLRSLSIILRIENNTEN
jgi:TRAP-type mannitol/chloroaromatic compound transport system permease small subunit